MGGQTRLGAEEGMAHVEVAFPATRCISGLPQLGPAQRERVRQLPAAAGGAKMGF